MVELASTESTQLVEVRLVACTTEESTSTNSKLPTGLIIDSHPGYFGKLGMRRFHLLRNQQHNPAVNLDKLWSIVSEETRKKAQASKDKAPVIDVTKAVKLYYI